MTKIIPVSPTGLCHGDPHARLSRPGRPTRRPHRPLATSVRPLGKACPLGHVRTPYYIRGKTGVIERILDVFPNPEEKAYGRSGLPGQRLYRVRFPQKEVWPDYDGPPEDTVDVELYHHWLELGGPA